jgi:hypothetical protein
MHARRHPRERAIAEVAERQWGVIADRQLKTLGVGRGAIQNRLELGQLHRLHRGVYALGHRHLSLRARWMAAVLASGQDAVLSHRDPAALWGLMLIGGTRIDVTVVARGRAQPEGIVLHQVRALAPADRATREGIPVTSLARTLLDIAETEPARTLRRAWDHAERLRVLDVRAVKDTCHRSPGRRGLKPLRALLADQTRYAPETKRELEALFVDFCREQRLPLPACNALVEGFEVDALWPAQRLIVELDSWEFHRGRKAFERDRERDAILQAAGYRVIRITWRRLTEEPTGVAHLLQRML